MVYEYSDPMEKFPSVELIADKLLMPQDINLDNVKGLAAKYLSCFTPLNL